MLGSSPHTKKSVESVRLVQQARRILSALYTNSAQSHVKRKKKRML